MYIVENKVIWRSLSAGYGHISALVNKIGVISAVVCNKSLSCIVASKSGRKLCLGGVLQTPCRDGELERESGLKRK